MFINCEKIGVKFPIFNSNQRSFKKRVLYAASGGKINLSPKGIIEVVALQDVSFKLKDNDRLALIGHNGSGKTTMLRVLAGAYKPTSGNIKVDGKITSLIDYMMGMDSELTGIENIKLRGLFLGLSKKEIKDIIDEIIDFSELGDFIHVPIRTYSSGMILRLGFSISTAIRPEILLMDEWMSVGDESFKKKAEHRLNNLVSKAAILVMATHDYELANRICSKSLKLEHGRVVKIGLN